MKNTEQVQNALGMLREADRGAAAPEFLETRLRAAFREKHAAAAPVPVPVVQAAPWWSAWRMWAGVAMASVVIGAVVYRAALPGSVEAPTPKSPPVVAATKPTPVPAPSTEEPKSAPPAVEVARAPKRAVRPIPAVPGVKPSEPLDVTSASARGDEFLAIPYAPPMTAQDRGEVIRVRLPRQSLRQFGIPVDPARLTERVPADVLIGEDGIPRGIRFVRASEGR